MRVDDSKGNGPIFRLGPGLGAEFEVGAAFFSLLAFPNFKDAPDRLEAEQAFKASWLHRQNEIDGTDEPFAEARFNTYAALSPKWAKQKLRTVKRRVSDRAKAARAARPWTTEVVKLGVHPNVAGIKKFTQRQIAQFLTDQYHEAGNNFEQRIWRQCRPIFHVAIAIDEALVSLNLPDGMTAIGLDRVDVYHAVVRRAGVLQPLIAADERFRVTANTQWTLEWIE